LVISFVVAVYAGALTVTMVTRGLVPDTRVVHACVLEGKGVDINTAILVALTRELTGSSVAVVLDMPVKYSSL